MRQKTDILGFQFSLLRIFEQIVLDILCMCLFCLCCTHFFVHLSCSVSCLNFFLFIHVFSRFRSLYCILPFLFCFLSLYYSLYLFCYFISGLSTLSPAPCSVLSPVCILFYLRLSCSVSGLPIVLSYFLLFPVSLLFSHIFFYVSGLPIVLLIFSVICYVSGLPIVLLICPVLFPVSLLWFSYALFCFRSPYCSHHLSCSVSGLHFVLIICLVLFPVSTFSRIYYYSLNVVVFRSLAELIPLVLAKSSWGVVKKACQSNRFCMVASLCQVRMVHPRNVRFQNVRMVTNIFVKFFSCFKPSRWAVCL
jgi:hypothetical protein